MIASCIKHHQLINYDNYFIITIGESQARELKKSSRIPVASALDDIHDCIVMICQACGLDKQKDHLDGWSFAGFALRRKFPRLPPSRERTALCAGKPSQRACRKRTAKRKRSACGKHLCRKWSFPRKQKDHLERWSFAGFALRRKFPRLPPSRERTALCAGKPSQRACRKRTAKQKRRRAASTCAESGASPTNKKAPKRVLFVGGGSWIRTSEVSDNRFTVCPLWPLGNSPI